MITALIMANEDRDAPSKNEAFATVMRAFGRARPGSAVAKALAEEAARLCEKRPKS
jgi:hypothetical protein